MSFACYKILEAMPLIAMTILSIQTLMCKQQSLHEGKVGCLEYGLKEEEVDMEYLFICPKIGSSQKQDQYEKVSPG